MTSSQFWRYQSLIQEAYANPAMRNLDLPGFLLKPVQRICKYPLLLREVMKNTSPDHPDFFDLNRAFERMSNGVATINECARRHDGLKLVIDVQGRFSEKLNIVTPTRFLVREDVIFVVFSNTKRTRKLFLFNDMAIICRKDWRDKHHVIEKIPLKDFRISNITAEKDGKSLDWLELEILPSTEFDVPNRYVVSFCNANDKSTWIDAYSSLVKLTVKSKNITDITMTSASSEAELEDDGERNSVISRDDNKNQFDFRARLSNLETLNETLNAKIYDLNLKFDMKSKEVIAKNASLTEATEKTQSLQTEYDGLVQIGVEKDQHIAECSKRIDYLNLENEKSGKELAESKAYNLNLLSQLKITQELHSKSDAELTTCKNEIKEKSDRIIALESNIISSEKSLNNQLVAFERYKEQAAEENRKKHEEYKNSKDLIKQELLESNEQLQKNTLKMQDIQKQNQALAKSLSSSEQVQKDQQKALLNLQDNLMAQTEKMSQAVRNHQLVQDELATLKYQVSQKDGEIMSLKDANTALKSRTIENQDELQSLRLTIKTTELARIDMETANNRSIAEIKDLKEKQSLLKEQSTTLQEKISKLESSRLQTVNEKDDTIFKCNSRIKDLESQLYEQDTRLKSLSSKLNQKEVELDALTVSIKEKVSITYSG
jgi:chromosome segregation ATPase